MRHTHIVLIALALMLTTLGPALATHNNAGMRMAIGNPDPTPDAEPNTPDDMLPIYHLSEVLDEDISPDISFWGDYPRVNPPEQSGLGLGGEDGWIGYINGMVEYVGAAFSRCLGFESTACENDPDPLYRVNPAADDDDCQGPEDNLDRGEDDTDPSDDPCSGEGHTQRVDAWPAVRIQGEKANQPLDQGRPGSGFLFPGTYSFYLYLFGEGSGLAAGEGVFDYLPTNLCEVSGGLGGAYADGSDKACDMILPEDIATDDRTDLESPTGSEQRTAICMFAPRFGTLSGASDVGACGNIMEFNQFFSDTDSSFYLANKPGWYIQSGFIDPDASLLPVTTFFTKGGVRDDIAQVFSFYVNPVRPAKTAICANPPIATNAPDELDTGIELVDENDPEGAWVQTEDFHYLVEAHEVDIYTGQPTPIIGGEDVETDRADPLIDQVNNFLDNPPLPPEVLPIVDAVQSAADRADPTVGTDAEPNAADDDTLELAVATETGPCPPTGLSRDAGGEEVFFYNYIQSSIFSAGTGVTLHDYTYTDEQGLPAESDDQSYNPWHPDTHSFSGSLFGFLDLNDNEAFDGCPPGADPPTAGSPDLCTALLPWDIYNEDAVRDSEQTMGEWARERGFTDPTGMYFVLDLTGPAVVTAENVPTNTEQAGESQDRLRITVGEGQHCFVGTSKGLLDNDFGQGDRFAEIIGAAGLSDNEITDALCPDATGEPHVIKDAFDDGSGAGGFSADVEWTKTSSSAAGFDQTEGDSLEVTAVLTVGPGVDEITADSLKLGSLDHDENTPTVEKVWGSGDTRAVTYVWTDSDPFNSDPSAQ